MTQRQKIGYKVLKPSRMSLFSTSDIGGVKYPKGKKVKPQQFHGPLCVFGSLLHAKNFRRTLISNGLVVKCKYTPSTFKYIWSTPCPYIKIYTSKLPRGTVLADSVTCLE